MKRFRWLAIILAIGLALVVYACGEDDDDGGGNADNEAYQSCDWEIHDPLIVAGKMHLGEGRIDEAYLAFRDAWETCPGSVDARMGLALTCQLELERRMYAMIDYLLSVYPEATGKSFFSTLQSVLFNQMLPKAQEMLEHGRFVQSAPANWSFYIDRYPFIVQGEFEDRVIVDMGGEWDLADAVMIEAGAEFYTALIYTLCAYDLTLDWYWVQHMPDISGMEIPEALRAILGWCLNVLEDPNYPMFMILKGEVGLRYLARAGLSWGSTFTLVATSAALMLLETDDQTDDVMGYVDENGNGRWDEGEPYKLPHIGGMTPDQNRNWLGMLSVALSLGYSAWDAGPLDVDPYNPNKVSLWEFNFLLEALGLEPVLPDIRFNLGPFFNFPKHDQLKQIMLFVIRLLYEALASDETVAG